MNSTASWGKQRFYDLNVSQNKLSFKSFNCFPSEPYISSQESNCLPPAAAFLSGRRSDLSEFCFVRNFVDTRAKNGLKVASFCALLRGKVVGTGLSCCNVVFIEAEAGLLEAKAAIARWSSTLCPSESSRTARSSSDRPTKICKLCCVLPNFQQAIKEIILRTECREPDTWSTSLLGSFLTLSEHNER